MNILLKIAPFIRCREIRILVYTLTTGKPAWSLFKATQKKGQVDIESLTDHLTETNLSGDKQYFPAEIPVILSLQGEGLVQRIYSGKPSELSKHIPNIEIKDYLFQYHTLEDERTFAALLRRDKVDSVLSGLRDQNILIGKVFLGFAGFIEFASSLGPDNRQVHAGTHFTELKQGHVISVGKSGESGVSARSFAEITAEGHKSVALGLAVSFFVHSFGPLEGRSPAESGHLKELVSAKLNLRILKCGFPALLGILLVNFLLFNHLQQNLEGVEQTRSGKKKIALEIERLKKEIDSKKELAEKANMRGYPVFAYYIDHLALLNVPGLRFEELSVDPVRSKIKAGEMIGFNRGSIVIKGTADKSESFGDLLEKLNAAGWVKTIPRQVYSYDNESGAAKFEVVLNYKKIGRNNQQ